MSIESLPALSPKEQKSRKLKLVRKSKGDTPSVITTKPATDETIWEHVPPRKNAPKLKGMPLPKSRAEQDTLTDPAMSKKEPDVKVVAPPSKYEETQEFPALKIDSPLDEATVELNQEKIPETIQQYTQRATFILEEIFASQNITDQNFKNKLINAVTAPAFYEGVKDLTDSELEERFAKLIMAQGAEKLEKARGKETLRIKAEKQRAKLDAERREQAAKHAMQEVLKKVQEIKE